MSERNYRAIPLGARKDPVDSRDYLKCGAAAPAAAELPKMAAVGYWPAIRDQGKRASCTGHAAAWMMEQIFRSRGMALPSLSAAFCWYHARALEAQTATDSGVAMRSVMSAIHKEGVCLEENWPSDRPWDHQPDDQASTVGRALALPRYERCESLEKIKYSIAVEGQSVVIGLPVFEDWYSEATRKTGNVAMPAYINQALGRHALAICGYDDRRKMLILANSWGVDFGARGYIFAPYEYLEEDFYFDAWTAGFEALPEKI